MFLGEEVSFYVPETDNTYYVSNIMADSGRVLGFGFYWFDNIDKKPIATFFVRPDDYYICAKFHEDSTCQCDLTPIMKDDMTKPYDELIRELKRTNKDPLYRLMRANGDYQYLVTVTDDYQLTVYRNDILNCYAPVASVSCKNRNHIISCIATDYNESYKIKTLK